MSKAGRLLILSGPSGVGKDTLIDAWKAKNARVERVVAYTTRQPRMGERDGLDYHFVPTSKFIEMAERGAFLEHKEVHGNYYATPLADMEAMLAEGKIAILKIDVQGALTVMELRPDALSVFVLPPSIEELEERIRGRGADDEPTIRKRLANALDEISLAGRYRTQIVNDDLEAAVSKLDALTS